MDKMSKKLRGNRDKEKWNDSHWVTAGQSEELLSYVLQLQGAE